MWSFCHFLFYFEMLPHTSAGSTSRLYSVSHLVSTTPLFNQLVSLFYYLYTASCVEIYFLFFYFHLLQCSSQISHQSKLHFLCFHYCTFSLLTCFLSNAQSYISEYLINKFIFDPFVHCKLSFIASFFFSHPSSLCSLIQPSCNCASLSALALCVVFL